jgi:DnaJ-domain-containing protein 1
MFKEDSEITDEERAAWYNMEVVTGEIVNLNIDEDIRNADWLKQKNPIQPAEPPQAKEPQVPDVPKLAIDEAYKLLNVTARTPWEEVEQARAKLVLRSHPDAMESLSKEKRAVALADAKRANAAYSVIAKGRSR